MKIKLSTICILLTLFVQTGKAQTSYGTWKLIDGPGNFTEQLNAMAWPSADTGFFIGNASTNLHITKTIDSGVDFLTSPFPNPIDTVHADTNGHAFVVYNHHTAIQTVADMAWPSNNTGFVVGITSSDNYGNTAVPTVLVTQNAGATWSQYYPADTLEQFGNIYFPSTTVGYASAASPSGTNYITKTTDGGKTWKNVYQSDTLIFKNLNFIDPNNGIVYAEGNASNSLHLCYTTNGATFKLASIKTDSAAYFLHWSNDSSWLVGADNVYRSKDSGKTWTTVVPYDVNAEAATVGAFYDDSGFIFRTNAQTFLMTTDYGQTWSSPSRLPGTDSLTPLVASMPSPYLAYLLAFDNTQTGNALLKIEFAVPGGVKVGVRENDIHAIPFAAAYESNAISFTMSPTPEARSIQVMDVLGRACTSLALAPNVVSSQLPTNALRPGTYFAKLDGSMVKFMIP
jgi:hypothetical protein